MYQFALNGQKQKFVDSRLAVDRDVDQESTEVLIEYQLSVDRGH